MKRAIFCLCALTLTACGPKVLDGDKEKFKTKQPVTCPGVVRFPTEEVTIFLTNPPPARLAVEVEGERKYSECQNIKDSPPVTRVERLPGNRLLVKFNRFDRSQLADLSFAVKNLKDCSAGSVEEDLVKEERTPITYVTDYPEGKGCAARETARLEIVR